MKMGLTADPHSLVKHIGKPQGGHGMSLRTLNDEQDPNYDFGQGYKDAKQSKSSMNNNAGNRDISKRNVINSVGPTIDNAASSTNMSKHKPISVWDQI